jgi:hypothetical protein
LRGLHGSGRLPFGEQAPDLGDVSLAAASGVGIESKLDRHVRRRQQGQLLGGVVFIHDSIVHRGCDRVVGSAAVPAELCPERRMVRVDPDDPDVDLQPFEAVERGPEPIHRRRVVDPSVADVEMQVVRGMEVGKRLEQPLDRRRADVAASPHETDRLERIVHVGHVDRAHVDRRNRDSTSASGAPQRSEPMSNAIEKVSRNCGVHAAKPALN